MDRTHSKLNIYCDGGSRGNPGPSASAFVVLSEEEELLFQEGKYLGIDTNNIAEYNAVLLAFKWLELNLFIFPALSSICLYLDSSLVVNQINGIFKIKKYTLLVLVEAIKKIQIKLIERSKIERKINLKIIYVYIPREKNKRADFLVNKTLDRNKSDCL